MLLQVTFKKMLEAIEKLLNKDYLPNGQMSFLASTKG